MTSKEKNLILAVAFIILVGLFWFFLYRPTTQNISKIEREITGLNSQLSELKLEYVNKDKYLDEIDTMTDFIEEINNRYPVYVSQEKVIKTLIDLEEEIETLEIPLYTMEVPKPVISAGEYTDEETGELNYHETLFKTEVRLDLIMTYADMKKMLTYIRQNEDKLSINGMNMTSDLVNDTVQTSFGLDFYFLLSDDRVYTPEDYFGDYDPKEESIFAPYDEFGASFDAGIEDGEAVKEEDDFVVNLSTIYSDRSTVIVYKNRDLTGDTYVYDDSNSMIPVEFVFEQTESGYSYKYKTSSEQFPGNYSLGQTFVPGNFIDIAVYSSARVDSDDKSGANVTIINNTDLPVNIRILVDDSNAPRFNVIDQVGEVLFEN